jgi:hypothetical protein
MAYKNKGEVRVLITKKKWDKGKRIIGALVRQRKESPWLDHKELERGRGFLIYLSRTYPPMTPFLLGLHQTIDGWRPYRHEDGWKMQQAEILAAQAGEEESGEEELLFDQTKYEPPRLVGAADRLQADLNMLEMLTSNECPPLRRIRASSTVKVLYGFGDASKGGFGWSIDFGDGVRYEFGEWCEDIQKKSSNYCEFRNLVNALLRAAEEGLLTGAEVFLFMDNQAAEGAYCRGTSPRRALFELVVKLYKLQMNYDLVLHVVWIAGTRMIQKGTDNLSRGGGMGPATRGVSLSGIVPLQFSVLEQSPLVLDWIRSWTGVLKLEVLYPEGWYTNGHKQGNFLCPPPSAAADAAVEQLCEAVHNRPLCTRVFIAPFLMTNRWRK